MKTVYTVTRNYLQDVRTLFRNHDVQVLPEDYRNIVADLIIFTGGEDINPFLYGNEGFPHWGTNPRDTLELNVLRDIRKSRLETKKVLGICRGLQLLNVGFGGTLTFDIATDYGRGHDYVHPLRWMISTVFTDFLGTVNSLHHQALQSYGQHGATPKILAIEPESGIPEAVLWNDKFLGVQFHPELFPDGRPEKAKFALAVESWVDGQDRILSGKSQKNVFDWAVKFEELIIPDEDDEEMDYVDPDDEEEDDE